jgi:hypothetical protein
VLKKSVVLAAFLTLTPPAFADTLCSSGTLDSVIGTTCDIGSFQFTFTGWNAENLLAREAPYTPPFEYDYSPGPPASEFNFMPISNGFTISGSVQVVGPGNSEYLLNETGTLSYTIADLAGVIVGENVTGTGFAATGTGASFAGDGGFSANSGGWNQVGGEYTEWQQGGVQWADSGQCVASTQMNCVGPPLILGDPFPSGSGTATAYDLEADSPTDSATWDGTATFTFTDEPTFANAPEPSSFLLLGTLVGLTLWLGQLAKPRIPSFAGKCSMPET